MRLIQLFLLVFFINFSFANEQNSDRNATYINIVSNLDDVEIFIDGKEMGIPPLVNVAITPHKEHNITAINTDLYHEKNITKRINLAINELQTVEFSFKPLKTEIFLVGEDGALYINGKFKKMLHSNNRVMKLDASPNINFGIYNKQKQTQFARDLKAEEFTQIKYVLNSIPKEIKLYTTFVGNLIWEDTTEATTTNVDFEAAQRYCKSLKIAYLDEWRLPTIEELDTLYEEYKDKIYNGYGDPFYWSADTFDGESGIWSYSQVKNFTVDGEVKKSIKEFANGKVRCVHDIAYQDRVAETKAQKPQSNDEVEEEKGPGYYDPDLTKDLKRFMLK